MNLVTPNTVSAPTVSPAEAKQILLKDISSRWGKFSEQELGALKNKDELVTQIVAKYSIDKAQDICASAATTRNTRAASEGARSMACR